MCFGLVRRCVARHGWVGLGKEDLVWLGKVGQCLVRLGTVRKIW